MAYQRMSANYVPGSLDDDYYMPPPPPPPLMAPEPQRHMPEMSTQIQHGLQDMSLGRTPSQSTLAREYRSEISNDLAHFSKQDEVPHLSLFPQLVNPPPNVPPSDEEFEMTLENARTPVLSSTDPEMQLAWAADALVYVGVCADYEERLSATKPNAARPATPRIEHQLKMDAMNIVTFLANQHHPKAEFLRGMWLEWGRFGQREDKKEAFRCYSRAADKGYSRAEYRIGMLYESYNDPIKALRHYHRGIDAGDAASCYRLGMMTLRGQHGQQQDWPRAIELIKKSAESADENAAQGAYVYGMLLARELPQVTVPDGVLPHDDQQAKNYIEKAAYLRFAKAQLKMGSAYELGALGCDFDPALAIHYSALASKQGEPEADMALSKWFLVGQEGLFPKNEELAYTYAERAAASGLATAEFAMGYFNEIGMHVPVDLDKSLEWYGKASKHGNEDAKGRVEGISRRQVLSRKDHENVAISRIKSQHGSMRAQHPGRQRQHAPSRLGQVSEDAYHSPVSSQPPAYPSRGSSITPYPVDDSAPTPSLGSRPASVAPYPVHDGPPNVSTYTRPSYLGAPQPPRPATAVYPDHRPSTAFQLAPEYRSASASAVPQLYDRQYQAMAGPGPASRPATTLPSQYGPPVNQRIVSSPPSIQNHPGPGPSPRPGQMQHPSTAPTAPPFQHPQAPRLDIGYSAPYDDRRKQYANPSPQQNRPAPGPLQSSQSMPNFDTVAPLRVTQKPLPSPQTIGGASPRPPPKQNTAAPGKPTVPQPSTQSAAPAPSKPAASQPRPPGKGPKTFEEMGLHGKQKDQDCVVM